MIVEFALAYGRQPEPGLSWRLFLVMLDLASRKHARAVLASMDGAVNAIASAFPGDGGGHEVEAAHERLIHAAWPVKRERQTIIRDVPDA